MFIDIVQQYDYLNIQQLGVFMYLHNATDVLQITGMMPIFHKLAHCVLLHGIYSIVTPSPIIPPTKMNNIYLQC